jgi:hypothetical protein
VQGAIFLLSKNPGFAPSIPIAQVVRHGNIGDVEPRRLRSVVPISLLRVCRQLRAECSVVLFGENIFRIWFLSETGLALCYRQLIRHITFDVQPHQRMYKPRWSGLEEVSYAWKRHFWPYVVEKGMKVLEQFSNVETVTIQLTSRDHGQAWRPAFFDIQHKTKEHRIAVAARWLHPRCPLENARLRACLRLELQPPHLLQEEDYKDSRFAREEEDESEWDYTEFAEAFQLMKSLE